MNRRCTPRAALAALAALTALLGPACTRQSPHWPEPPDAGDPADVPERSRLDAGPPDDGVVPPSPTTPGSGAGPACAADADCARGGRCVRGRCVEGCRYHEQCPGALDDEGRGAPQPLCAPRGICAARGVEGPLHPAVGVDERASPALERRLIGERAVFALGDPGLCLAPKGAAVRGLPDGGSMLDAVRIDVVSPAQASVERDAATCTVTVDVPAPPEGRLPVRVRARAVVGPGGGDDTARAAFVRFGSRARRYVALLEVDAGEADAPGPRLRLPMLFTLADHLGAQPTAGVVEAAGTPFFVADRPLALRPQGEGWQLDARDVRPSALLAGPAPGRDARAETEISLHLAAHPGEPGLLTGTFDLRLAGAGDDWSSLRGSVRAWPGPATASAVSAPAPARTLPPDDPSPGVDCAELWGALAHLPPAEVVACLTGEGCCPGPSPWRADAPAELDAHWQALRAGYDRALAGGAPHLAAVCAAPVEGCTGRGGDPCLDWPVSCDRGACRLPPAVAARPESPACVDALDLGVGGGSSFDAPACVDLQRALCATALHRLPMATLDEARQAALDRVHAGLLAAGARAATQRMGEGGGAALASLDLLTVALGEVMRPEWHPGLRPATPPDEELVEALAAAVGAWIELVDLLVDPLVDPRTALIGARRVAQASAIDALALLARLDGLAPGRAAPLAADAGRALWRLAVSALPVPALHLSLDRPRADRPPSAMALADALFDQALETVDRASVERGRLAARRGELAEWTARDPRCRAWAALEPMSPAPIERVDAEWAALAEQPPMAPAWPVALRDGSTGARDPGWAAHVSAADALARLATEPPPPRESHDASPPWPPLPPCDPEPPPAWPDDEARLFEALVAEGEAARLGLRAAGAAAERSRRAHWAATRVAIAHDLWTDPFGPLAEAGGADPSSEWARLLLRAAALDHLSGTEPALVDWQRRHPDEAVDAPARPPAEERSDDEVERGSHRISLACDVLHLCSPGAIADRPGVVGALRDPITGSHIPPAERWLDAISRLPRHDATHRRIDLIVVPDDDRCSRLTREVRVEIARRGEAPATWATLPAEITPEGPRLDHRCSDRSPILVDAGAMTEAGPPGGRWRLVLSDEALRSASDVVVHIDYEALTGPLPCPHCRVEDADDFAP